MSDPIPFIDKDGEAANLMAAYKHKLGNSISKFSSAPPKTERPEMGFKQFDWSQFVNTSRAELMKELNEKYQISDQGELVPKKNNVGINLYSPDLDKLYKMFFRIERLKECYYTYIAWKESGGAKNVPIWMLTKQCKSNSNNVRVPGTELPDFQANAETYQQVTSMFGNGVEDDNSFIIAQNALQFLEDKNAESRVYRLAESLTGVNNNHMKDKFYVPSYNLF
jgi:hypothetical protein